MSATARTAFDPAAPLEERYGAQAELTREHTSLADILPRENVQPVIDYIEAQYEESRLLKAAQIIPFPGRTRKEGENGMQSVYLDGLQIYAHGDYFERPSPIGYEALRQMVDQTPILSAVLMTRVRQVHRFASPQDDEGPGFVIRHIDKDHTLSKEEQDSTRLLSRFVQHCGWEFNPRRRKGLKRDNFSQFLAKLVRESLTYDSAPIETELKRNRKEGLDGFYALDGSTIRLCTEDGYRGDDAIYAVQVVQGQIVTAYTTDDLIYEPRNPRADVRLAGYGLGETELLIRVVTGWLNAMAYNVKGFDSNAIPKGILNLVGEYSAEDLSAFRRYWNAMVRGVNNAWALPIMASRTAESKVTYEKIDNNFTDVMFSKWMTFLTSIICAVYGMSPAEINFDAFTSSSTSPLSGSDTAEKLASSRDSGLRPLMSYLESTISDFIVADFSDRYVFRWAGLDEQDQQQKFEMRKLVLTVNEARAQEGIPPLKGPMGDAPINPSLVGPWMQLTQAPPEGEGGDGPPPPGGLDESHGEPPPEEADAAGDPQAPQEAQDAPPDQGQAKAKGEPDHAALAQQMAEEMAGQGLAKANAHHDAKGQFARTPEVRYEKRQLHELYDYTLKHPLAAADAALVTLNANDLAVQLDKGPAVEGRDGDITVRGRHGLGQGYGMVKVIWRHGEKSGKVDDDRVTRGDVLALPEVVRTTPSVVVADADGNPKKWEWRRKRFDGQTVAYGVSRFTGTDDRNHIVTIHVDRQTDMKKAAMCVAGDFCGRTPQLPAEAISVSPSAVGLLHIQYRTDDGPVKVDSFASVVPEIWRPGV